MPNPSPAPPNPTPPHSTLLRPAQPYPAPPGPAQPHSARAFGPLGDLHGAGSTFHEPAMAAMKLGQASLASAADRPSTSNVQHRRLLFKNLNMCRSAHQKNACPRRETTSSRVWMPNSFQVLRLRHALQERSSIAGVGERVRVGQ